jgi:hypothetical protein
VCEFLLYIKGLLWLAQPPTSRGQKTLVASLVASTLLSIELVKRLGVGWLLYRTKAPKLYQMSHETGKPHCKRVINTNRSIIMGQVMTCVIIIYIFCLTVLRAIVACVISLLCFKIITFTITTFHTWSTYFITCLDANTLTFATNSCFLFSNINWQMRRLDTSNYHFVVIKLIC